MPMRSIALVVLLGAPLGVLSGVLAGVLAGCGPGGSGPDAAATDARPDVLRDAATDAPTDGAPDAPPVCSGPCPECMICVAGECIPTSDGQGCGGGVCRGGACCTGCWDGDACLDGAGDGACGGGGARCRICDCAGDTCTDGNCVPQRPAATVAVGSASTCATDTAGRLLCWGGGSRGTVGHGGFDAVIETPRDIGHAVQVAVGGAHACAILPDGTMHCWGANEHGQLGLGDLGVDRNAPAIVPGLAGITALSLGEAFTCAVSGAGKLRCWGAGASGQLGLGTTDDVPVPTAVVGAPAGGTWLTVGAGTHHACALDGDQHLHCWGANERGQLGLGVRGITRGRPTPTLVDEAIRFTGLTAGRFHTCAAGAARDLSCWGANDRGQLGTGDRIDRRWPTRVGGALLLADAGSVHGCAVLSVGTLACWGDGGDGRLGLGDTTDRLDANLVGIRRNYVTLSAGDRHTCVIDDVGGLYCWGDGSTGQLGAPETARSLRPVRACLPTAP